MYDFLIVGAGLYGAVFARQAVSKGLTSLVIDRRDHIAGNIYTEKVEGINFHKYGAHIFHTRGEPFQVLIYSLSRKKSSVFSFFLNI